MRNLAALVAAGIVVAALAVTALAAPPSVAGDVKVSDATYVRHDGGADATITGCNSTDPTFVDGNNRQENEPFAVVNPTNPAIVASGWNDYCSGWMGLGLSADGGRTWVNSLVPGYPADDSTLGAQSPEHIRTNAASDPVAAFSPDGEWFYFGSISFNENAGPKTNSDVWVARYRVRPERVVGGRAYPLDYVGTTQIGEGPSASGFHGVFTDKEMLEVDRTANAATRGNLYFCWTKFPGSGQTTIHFTRSSDNGATFSKPIQVGQYASGQGCDIAVEADGDVYVIWRDFELQGSKKNFGVSFVRSTDGGRTFSKVQKVADLIAYNPFDGTRDCGDGIDACPSGFVFGRVPLEPRVTADPTGVLPGVFVVVQASDASTIVPSASSYSSAGPGLVGRGVVQIYRSTDDGKTWTGPIAVDPAGGIGHQFFPDADAYKGRLAVVWQDSRNDPAYSIQRPVGNTATAESSGLQVLDSFVAVSTDGATFSTARASTRGQQPQYEMFDAASVPFLGDYNWVHLVDHPAGGLVGFAAWTDNRDVVAGTDPRESAQDGFDTEGCWAGTPPARTCLNGGGYNQNIYGASFRIP